MIIVDDCSDDNSVELIKGYCDRDSRIRLIELESNSGAGVARNRAIAEAKGDMIAFLDADDMWKPEKLDRQIAFMREHNLAFTYSSYEVIDEQNNNLTTFYTRESVDYDSLLKTCSIGCLTAIYDVGKLGKVYMPNMRRRQDYALWLDIFKRIDGAKGLVESLAYYRVGHTSISSNKLKTALWQWKTYRNIEKLSLPKSLYYFSHYIYYGFRKYR
jgi:glycosyltransferase involved in cell wall biosynthesis